MLDNSIFGGILYWHGFREIYIGIPTGTTCDPLVVYLFIYLFIFSQSDAIDDFDINGMDIKSTWNDVEFVELSSCVISSLKYSILSKIYDKPDDFDFDIVYIPICDADIIQ